MAMFGNALFSQNAHTHARARVLRATIVYKHWAERVREPVRGKRGAPGNPRHLSARPAIFTELIYTIPHKIISMIAYNMYNNNAYSWWIHCND